MGSRRFTLLSLLLLGGLCWGASCGVSRLLEPRPAAPGERVARHLAECPYCRGLGAAPRPGRCPGLDAAAERARLTGEWARRAQPSFQAGGPPAPTQATQSAR